ncbi:hypothetical protein MXD61_14270 [Frankia sp. AgPm24]|uniref:hypothetical protein n=1 Tax=Frankia sp. AgPm24 TaxID=631128 RepID=UPI00200E095C|nr:hypothetical protein [Frankia sp. AgPm24]MCK9923021.1 hypothetical protein [Frankia sp. AgPm24]
MSTATAMVTAGLCLAGVGIAAGGGAPGPVCLVIALLGFVALLRTLSRLVIVYVTVVTITMVVAGRIVSANALLVPSAIPAPRDDLADTCAALWIAVAATAGTISAHRARRRRARRHATGGAAAAEATSAEAAALRMTWGVLALSALAAAGQAFLLAAGAVGVSAQYAGGTSGAGYPGLLAAAGPVLAGAALVSAHADRTSDPEHPTGPRRTAGPKHPTGPRRTAGPGRTAGTRRIGGLGRMPSIGLRTAAWAMFAVQAVLLVLTGFRGAAPQLCLAALLAGAGVGADRGVLADARGGQRTGRCPVWLSRAGRAVLAVSVIGGLFVAGSIVRSDLADASGYQFGASNPTSGPLGTVVVRRLDYRPYLLRALELRDDPGARAAVRLDDQLGVLVPRFLYPNKPTADQGRRLSHAVFDLPPDLPTSSTITAFGDGVINLGLVGAMLLIGAWVLVLDTMFRAAGRGRSVAACALRIMVLQAAFDTATPPIMQLATSLRALGILSLLLATLAMLTRRIRPATASASQPGVVAAHPTSRAVSPPVPAVRAGAAAVPTGGRGPSSATRRPALWPAWPTQRGATDAHPGSSGTATERDHAQKW